MTPWIVKNKFLFADPQPPPVTRKSARLITPHIPRVTLMYCGISASDSSNITHIIHIKLSISQRTITLAPHATTKSRRWPFFLVCQRVDAALEASRMLAFFCPILHLYLFAPKSFPVSNRLLTLPIFSLTPSISFTLSGNLPCNCCSLHHRIAWLHSSHSYWLPVTGRGVSPTGPKLHLGVLPMYAICVFSLLHCSGFQFLKPSWGFCLKLRLYECLVTRFWGWFFHGISLVLSLCCKVDVFTEGSNGCPFLSMIPSMIHRDD